MKRTFVTLFFGLLIATGTLFSQDVAAIESAFKRSDASLLAPQLSDAIELSSPSSSGTFDKSGFISTMNHFFSANPCRNCVVVHQGGRGDSKFVICTANCSKGDFRVHFFFKKFNNQYLITSVRIETTNG